MDNKINFQEEKLARTISTKLTFHMVLINGMHIRYVTAGDGEPLLLLHGANFGWGAWYTNIAALAKHFYVYALDLPGAGASTKIDFFEADLDRDFVHLVESFIAIQQLRHFVVVAHSFGGWIALKLRASKKFDIRRMVIVDTVGLSTFVPRQYTLVPSVLIRRLIVPFFMPLSYKRVEYLLKSALKQKESLEMSFIEYVYLSLKDDPRAHPLLFMNRLSHDTRRGKLLLTHTLDIACTPLLLIMGNCDPLLPVRTITQMFSHSTQAEIVIFSDSGHVPPLERPRQFNETVLKFLQS